MTLSGAYDRELKLSDWDTLKRFSLLDQLVLTGVDADPDFYESLAKLPDLTYLLLEFHLHMTISTSTAFHSAINLLTNLTFLSIFVAYPCPAGLVESLATRRKLKRLQTLRVPFREVHDQLRSKLFSNLPSLRRIHVDVTYGPYSW